MIVGSRFIGVESRHLLGLTELVLEPQPDNEHDSNAIAVISNGKRVGWVAKTSQKDVPMLSGATEFETINVYLETRNAITATLVKKK